jgi:HEAT repeat protein/ATP/ADP translocase
MGMLKNLFDVRPEEWSRFSLLFIAFFIFNMGMSWAGASTRGVVVAEFGENFIKYGFVWYGIVTILVSIAYTAYVDRIPKHNLTVMMTVLCVVFVGFSIVIAWFPQGRAYGALGLFVLNKVILLVWVQQWTTSVLDFYDSRASKRILPLLSTSRLFGIALGGIIFSVAVKQFGVSADAFFNYWFVTLVIVLAILWALPRLLHDPKPEKSANSEPVLEGLKEGFAYIGRSNFLIWMTISAVLMNAQIALFEISSTVLADQYYQSNADAVSVFFANVDSVFSVVLLVVQVLVFPRMMKAFGLGGMNLVYPLFSLGVGGMIALATTRLFGATFNLVTAATAYIDIEPFRRVFRTPINGLLVNAVPSFMKGRSRAVINGVISPAANIVIALAVLIETIPLPGGRAISADNIFIVMAVVVSIAYAYTGFILKREYGKSMVKLLESEDYAALLSRDYAWGAVDTDALKQLEKRLGETTDAEFAHFIATIMLESGGADAVPLLITRAREADGDVKRSIMNVLLEGDIRGDVVRGFYIENQSNADPLIRRAALLGLMHIVGANEEIRFQIASDHAHDRDPVVRAEAIKTLYQSDFIGHKDTAERVLKAMQSDFHPESRIAAINAMTDLGEAQGIRQLVWFMEDEDDEVRLAATVGIEKLWRADMPQDITQLILDREKLLLDDPIERIRQAELRVLGKIGSDTAAATLIRALVDSSPVIREAAMDVLAALGNNAVPSLLKASQSSDRQLAKQAMIVLTRINHDRYDDALIRMVYDTLDEIYANHAILHVLDDCKAYPSFGVLRLHFVERNRRLLTDIFDMLRTIYGTTAVNTIYETLQSENARTRINAVEALESLAIPEMAQQIAPLFEPNVKSETLAQGYYDRKKLAPKSTDVILRELATGDDTWLRAVSVMALGEVAADNDNIRRVILGDENIPRAKTGQLLPCQKHINPDIAAVTVRTALASKNPDVKRAARAVMRLIRRETVFDTLAEMDDKENPTVLSTIERMIYLKRVPFFQSLSVEQLKALATICDEKIFKKGQQVFKQGEQGGSLYIVVTGRVEVGLMNSQQDTFTMLATYEVNTVFGEMSLFDGQPRSADAIATEDTLTLTIRREPFLALTRQYPDLSIHLIMTLSDRLRHANEQIARLNNTMRETIDV